MLIRPATGNEIQKKSADISKKEQKTSAKAPEIQGEKSSGFQAILDAVLPPSNTENLDLHNLWERLPQAEKDVIENPTLRNLEIYKDIVKKILHQSLNRIFRLESVEYKTRTRGLVKQDYVRIIDEKLHFMALTIQSGSNTAFSILKNLEDIRGMLIDLKDGT